ERVARTEAQEKVYELTLKQAALPGLPPPVSRTNASMANIEAHSKPEAIAVGTNSLSAPNLTPSANPKLDDSADEEKTPVPDADLLESEHIMVDYLSLFPKNNVATNIP